jgi:hypothetical protein
MSQHRRAGGPGEAFRLVDVFRRGADHRGCLAQAISPARKYPAGSVIVAAALAAISAIFVMPYYPVWSLICIVIAIMVIYGLSARYGERAA